MTLLDRLAGGPMMVGALVVGPVLQWPALVAPILILTAAAIWLAAKASARPKLLWLLALSPLGWLGTALIGGWAVCDRANGDRCRLAGYVGVVELALLLAGLAYGIFLIVRLKGVRFAPCSVFIVNLGYSLLALLAASEAASGVSL